MAEELEKKELKIDELIASKGRSFFLRADGIIHNGVNIESTEAINCIADGKIIAMRLSEDYKDIESINKDLEFDNNYLSYYHLSHKFSEEKGNLIKIEKQDDSNKQNKTNSNNEPNNSDANNKKEEIFYFTKKISKDNKETYKFNNDLKDFDRIEGLYFLNEIISNNFILIEHDLTKNNGDQIKFYSLYNHLAPQGRMTYEQRLNLPWYEHKITLNNSVVKGILTEGGEFIPCESYVKTDTTKDKNDNKYINYNGKWHYIKSSYLDTSCSEIHMPSAIDKKNIKEISGIPVYSLNSNKTRTFKEILPVTTEFDFEFKNIKSFTTSFYGKMQLKVKYGDNKEGYIYLNEDKSYDQKTWNEAISKFYDVINVDKDFVDFLNFQIKIPYKKDFSKDKIKNAEIIYPENCAITSGKIIGYSGFNFMRKDTIADKEVIVQDTKQEDNKKIALTAPFTVHIETFFKDESEVKFNYKDESKWDPFYFKLSKEYKAFTKKPTTNCKSAENVSYDMALIELLDEVKYYSDDIFYKIKIIANIIINTDRWVINGKYTKWDGNNTNKYHSKDNASYLNPELYNGKSQKVNNNKNYKFLPGFIYICNGKDNIEDLRRFEYFYEPISDEYYLKKSDYDKFNKESGSKIYDSAIQDKHFFIKNKLDSTNLFLSIEKEKLDDDNTETLTGSTENPIKFEYQNKKIDEYDTLKSIKPSTKWYKTKANATEYWIKSTDIIEKGGNDIEVFSYNDWSKVFNVLDLNEGKKPIFYIDGYKSLNKLTGKSLEEQKEKNAKNLKKALGLKKDTPENEHLINKIMSHKIKDSKFLFKHHNEWDNNDELQKVYKDLKNKITKEKYEKTLKEYSFMDQLKTKLDNKDSFFYVNPYYFIQNLDKIITIPDFNPYEGKTITTPYSYVTKKNKNTGVERNVGTPGITMNVRDNPGFAPLHRENKDETKYVYNSKMFSEITGGFREDYIDVERGTGNTYREEGNTSFFHEGLDFHGNDNHDIISLINGEVLAWGWYGSYGRTIFVGHSSGEGVYLLAHLKSYNETVLKKTKIRPWDVMGIVGGSGNGKDGNYNTHLHLSYYKTEWKNKKLFLNSINNGNKIITKNTDYNVINYNYLRNPFNHKEPYYK